MSTVKLKMQSITGIQGVTKWGTPFIEAECEMDELDMRHAFEAILEHVTEADLVKWLEENGIGVKHD